MDYLPRIVDSELDLRLRAVGATVIVGPKWCGKTTTAKQKAKSILEMQDPDMQDGYLKLAATKPSMLLEGANPRLIDEWPLAPVLWDAVRVSVDRRKEKGLYLLTGSVVVDEDKIKHTGIGRISRLEMDTMSLFETDESSGEVSLKKLFADPAAPIDGAKGKLTVEELIFAVCRGGWPSSLEAVGDDAKLFVATDYFNNVVDVDISRVDDVARDPVLAAQLLRSYARNISTLATKASIRKDVLSVREVSLPTVDSYLSALRRLFVIHDVEAWCPTIRSATDIRASHKRGFSDPSIAVAAMGVGPEYFRTDFKTFGFLFESLVMRDLRVYSRALGGRISYYRDRYGLEADAVLHLKDGRYALIEVKLGSNEIEEGAGHLKEIKRLVAEYNKSETQCPLRLPDLLMVITGGKYAYTRDDGVVICPISALRP
ncbi:MAG: ATP-binding protein [Kiritimatiellae bacterium]|nr:ATP-binding protein [Kiritimatiellia bacterium]